ncbi:patatin-like phospholipase family protein [Anaerobranca gottschalkii]|uniref:NTE family protein n=1 Tax=Anaerobranca gottschalkii DSM 13577 TaxID=1120990 RepID=A0A1I0CMU8_9FIRM|nr:patatin-like phospholipase family protein [Anaerobranca gottschalkii]SET20971.1 NTE family protein [Anaerobranca gottschalkii DSM 13577]
MGVSFSGGGQRGIAHIGVLKGLQRDNIPISAVSGSSVGAIMAAALAKGKSYRDLIDVVNTLEQKDVLDVRINIWSIIKGYFCLLLGNFSLENTNYWSLLKGERMTKILKQIFGEEDISTIKTPLAITAVDINTGLDTIFTNVPQAFSDFEGLVISEIPLYLAIRASISIPLVYRGVNYKEGYFIDGGLTNNVPVFLVKKLGCKKTISVEVTKRPPFDNRPQGIIDLGSRVITVAVDNSKYFAIPDIVIKPNIPTVNLGNFDKTKELIDIGYKAYLEIRENLL